MAAEVVDRETGEITQEEARTCGSTGPLHPAAPGEAHRHLRRAAGPAPPAEQGVLQRRHPGRAAAHGGERADRRLHRPGAGVRRPEPGRGDPGDLGHRGRRPQQRHAQMMQPPAPDGGDEGQGQGPAGRRATWGWPPWRSWGRRSRRGRPAGGAERRPKPLTNLPPVEGIQVSGKVYTRPQVEAAYKVRRAEAERLGVALPSEVATLVAPERRRSRCLVGRHADPQEAGRGHPGGAAVVNCRWLRSLHGTIHQECTDRWLSKGGSGSGRDAARGRSRRCSTTKWSGARWRSRSWWLRCGAVRALVEYGRHNEGCSAAHGDQYRCRCGWRDVEAEVA